MISKGLYSCRLEGGRLTEIEQQQVTFFFLVGLWPGTKGDSVEGTDEPSSSSSSCPGAGSFKGGLKSKVRNQQQTKTSTGGQKYNAMRDQKEAKLILRPGHVEDFGIHGLWPQYIKNIYHLPDPVNRECYPEYCPKKNDDVHQPQTYERHDYSQIKHLDTDKDGLNKHWHSTASPEVSGATPQPEKVFGKTVNSKIKQGIWEHEWEKHGTCSLMNQARYFETSLQLKRQNNLLEALDHADIKPDGKVYSSELIMNTIMNARSNNKVVRIDCNEKNELYQIHICFTKGEILEFMDCPGNPVDVHCTNPQEIIFPKFPLESKKK